MTFSLALSSAGRVRHMNIGLFSTLEKVRLETAGVKGNDFTSVCLETPTKQLSLVRNLWIELKFKQKSTSWSEDSI